MFQGVCSLEWCKKTDGNMNEWAHFMCAFVDSYSIMSVCGGAEECWICLQAFERRSWKAKSHGDGDMENGRKLCRRNQRRIFGHRTLQEEVRSDYSRGFSKGATRKLSEETCAEQWVEDELSS